MGRWRQRLTEGVSEACAGSAVSQSHYFLVLHECSWPVPVI